MKKLITAALAIATIAGSVLAGTAHAAGSASFTLSPSSGSYTQGNSFSVQVHENGSDVNVVTAKLTYDASKLTCTGVSGGSAFPNSVATSCANGTVTISRYTGMDGDGNPTTVSGDQVVGTVGFTATGTGTATVAIAAGSQIASNGSNIWNGSANSGSYTINAPVTGGQGGGSGSTSTGSTNGSTSSTSGSNSSSSTGSSNSSNKSSTTTANGSKVATNSTANTSSNSAVASDQTANAATTSKDSKSADNKSLSTSKTADKKSGKAWLWILIAVVVIAGGIVAIRKYLQSRAAAPAEEAEAPKASKKAASTK